MFNSVMHSKLLADLKKRHLDWEELVFLRIAMPLITLIYYCFIARHSFRTEYLTKWVIGNSMLLCNYTCVFTIGGTFEGERYYGRLKWLIVSPYSRIATVIQKGLFFIFESIATVILCITFGTLLFGVDFTNVNLGLFMVIMIVGILAAICFGLFLSVFSLLSDSMHLLLNLVNVSMLILCGANFPVKGGKSHGYYEPCAILCGANFPVKELPKAVQLVSYCLPFTRSIEAANMLFHEVNKNRFLSLLGQEICVGAVYLTLGVILLKTIEKIAIRKATLEIF
ncbi:MAG TPA: ABC transporter permease [Thermoclostridium sp.]